MKGALYKSIENGDPELISGLAGSALAGASPSVSNSFLLLQNLRTQQAALASQVASDSSKYGSANPKLGDERASLDSINSGIKAEIKRIGERAANDYQASQVVENNMRDVYSQQRKVADNLNDKTIALLIARQEAADARNLYQTLYSHLKEAGVIEGLRSSNISVVDPGQIPAKPIPYSLICLVLSLFVGSFFGLCAAVFAEATDDRIEGIVSIEALLQAPVMAVLPMIQRRALSLGGVSSKVRPRLPNGNQTAEASRIAVLDGPNTAYVEALRGLRTSLLNPRKGEAPRTILITSATEQEGKSTLSLNLAAALVLNGSRVLVVDGDLRIAGLSSYMGYERKTSGLFSRDVHGLSEALSTPDDPQILTPFAELPDLSALPAGSAPKYPAELLGRERLTTLVNTWKDDYDYVVIDSPPVLAVADALILARLVDTTLLVTRHGLSTQKSLERAYYTLHDMESRKVDIVVNGVQRTSVSFNEFYGYQGTTYYSEA
jgi:succinoglycan biosynthesis transport protein ExoP